MIKFDAIGVVQYDEAGNEIAWHLADKCKQMRDGLCDGISQEETITWWVYQQQQAVVILSVDRETRFPRVLDLMRICGIRSACAAPLTTVHRRLGVLFLGSEESEAYSEQNMCFLSLVATLQAIPRDAACKTRCQDGFAAFLSCRALSSPTTCRFIPALPNSKTLSTVPASSGSYISTPPGGNDVPFQFHRLSGIDEAAYHAVGYPRHHNM